MSAQMPNLTRSFSNLSNASTLLDKGTEEVSLGPAPSVKDLERRILAEGVPDIDSLEHQLAKEKSKTAKLCQALATPQTPLLEKKKAPSSALFEKNYHSITQSDDEELLLTNTSVSTKERFASAAFRGLVCGTFFIFPGVATSLLATEAPMAFRVLFPLGVVGYGVTAGAIVGFLTPERRVEPQDSAV